MATSTVKRITITTSRGASLPAVSKLVVHGRPTSRRDDLLLGRTIAPTDGPHLRASQSSKLQLHSQERSCARPALRAAGALSTPTRDTASSLRQKFKVLRIEQFGQDGLKQRLKPP